MFNIREKLAQSRKDERGVTLIELIIGMSLLSMIGTLCAAIMISSVRTQTDVSNSTLGSAAAQTFSVQLTKNVRSAQHFRVRNSVWVDIKTANGRCMSYVIYNGKMYRQISTNAITGFSPTTWTIVLPNVRKVGTTDYFRNSAALGLNYSISSGTGISHIDLVGIATPRVVQANALPCW